MPVRRLRRQAHPPPDPRGPVKPGSPEDDDLRVWQEELEETVSWIAGLTAVDGATVIKTLLNNVNRAGLQGALTTLLGRVCSTTELPGLMAEKFNARVKQGNVDLIFLGDSITEGWEGSGKKAWEKEIRKMMSNGFKMEVEAMVNKRMTYLTEEYVPMKLRERKQWLD